LHDLASIQGPHGTIFGIKTTSVFQVDATKGSENTISKWKGSAAAAAASKFLIIDQIINKLSKISKTLKRILALLVWSTEQLVTS
jgi:hypothetical protein